MPRSPLIVLLTDYGITDHFVGVLKGVIAVIAPGIPIVDLTHAIPAGDVRRAALTLWQAVPYFPSGSVFLCVVDPGVGTLRRAVVLDCGGKRFVGPDNGLFTFIQTQDCQAWELTNQVYALPDPSLTFHGRDLFAPAAAHAALGVPGDQFGPIVLDLHSLERPVLTIDSLGNLVGEILHADHFGNLLTSLGRFEDLRNGGVFFKPWQPGGDEHTYQSERLAVALPDGLKLIRVNTFADIPAGECAFLIGSSGLIEIVANHQSAEQLLDLHGGETVRLEVR